MTEQEVANTTAMKAGLILLSELESLNNTNPFLSMAITVSVIEGLRQSAVELFTATRQPLNDTQDIIKPGLNRNLFTKMIHRIGIADQLPPER